MVCNFHSISELHTIKSTYQPLDRRDRATYSSSADTSAACRHFKRNTYATFLLAAIPPYVFKGTLAAEIIFGEVAINELAFDKAAARKARSPESAVFESATNENAAIEQAPIDIQIAQCARKKGTLDRPALCMKPLDRTKPEDYIFAGKEHRRGVSYFLRLDEHGC